MRTPTQCYGSFDAQFKEQELHILLQDIAICVEPPTHADPEWKDEEIMLNKPLAGGSLKAAHDIQHGAGLLWWLPCLGVRVVWGLS